MDECHECSSRMVREKVKIKFQDNEVELDALRCEGCGEVLLDPEQTQRLLFLNKLYRGVEAKVGILGKSLVVRIPVDVKEFLGLSKGDHVLFTTDGKRLVLEKA